VITGNLLEKEYSIGAVTGTRPEASKQHHWMQLFQKYTEHNQTVNDGA